MQINISTRHGHLSDETQEQIKEKLERLSRFYDRLSTIEVMVDLEHREAPNVDLRVSAEHKHDFVAVAGDGVDGRDRRGRGEDGATAAEVQEKVQDRHRGPGPREAEPPADVHPSKP